MTTSENGYSLESLVKRFNFERMWGNNKPTMKAYCTLCKETVVQCEGVYSSWNLTRYPKDHTETIAALDKHVKSHDMRSCKFCGEIMTSRGMTRHQSSNDCISARRKFQMRERGYETICLNKIKEAIYVLKEQITSSVEFDEIDVHFFIDKEAEAALKFFQDKLEVLYVNSDFSEGYNSFYGKNLNLWKLDTWAPADISQYLDLIDKNYKNLPWSEIKQMDNKDIVKMARIKAANYLSDVTKFAEAEEEIRRSMICVAELANETV